MRVFSGPQDSSYAAAITGAYSTSHGPDDAAKAALPLQRALADATQRLQDVEARGDPYRIALALHELGSAEHAAGAPDLAVATFEHADTVFATLPGSSDHARLLLSLASAYEAVERFREALEVFKRFHTLETSINQRAREEWRRAEAAEAQLIKTRNELTLALRRQAELADINAHLVRVERQKTGQLQQAERFSLEDSVTQVHNRRCLDVRLAADVQRARRYASPLTIAMVDIDDFKSINDQFSHTSGDEVLRRVAGLMRDALRDCDYVARYGGDEFVLVFPETRLTNARLVCEMVRERVATENWGSILPDLRVTVSIGVAERSPVANTPDVLLNAADRMLYRAKHAGKNSVAPAEKSTGAALRRPAT